MKTLILLIVLFLTQTLRAQTATAPTGGDGTSGSPYQIASLENLYWIASDVTRWDKYYIQTANIDASSTSTWFTNGSGGYYGWIPIGNTATKFTGTYNGNGKTISGIYINRPLIDNVGLLGYTSGAAISNVGLVGGSVVGQNYIGGLVGFNDGYSTIDNSYNRGTVSGYSQIGGLVGNNYNGTISKSYNTGTIGNGIITTSGSYYVGGLVGHNHLGNINNCYNSGNIDGGYWGVGGLVGYNNTDGGIVDKCYSTGHISAYPDRDPTHGLYRFGGLVGDCCSGPVYDSYWDIETSGTTSSPSGQGTGKTTTEMKTQSTFNGWDFTTVWEIIGTNYPRLKSNPDPALEIEAEANLLPTEFALIQNYPNPFNPATVISYQLPVYSFITLKVYDVLGNEVAVLVNEEKQPGTYEVEFQSAISSRQLSSGVSAKGGYASGVYFYQLRAGNFVQMKKMIVLK